MNDMLSPDIVFPDIKIKSLKDIEHVEQTPLSALNLPSSTYELLARSAAKQPEATALRFLTKATLDETPVTLSYRQLFARVTQTANAFHSLGMSSQDTVSMLLPIIPQAHFTIWGGEAAGIVNPINPMLEVEHIAAIVNEAKTKILVTVGPQLNQDIWHKAQQLQALCPSLQYVLTVDPAGHTEAAHHNDKVLNFDSQIAQHASDKLNSGREIKSSDVASYFHTGGTTGTPKLAPHTHFNEVVNCWHIVFALQFNQQTTAMCGLPLFHVNGVLITGLAVWMAGGEAILGTPAGYRTPELMQNFWGLIEKYQVSFFSAVPTILNGLLNFPTEGYDLSSLDVALCGAAPLATELMRNFEQQTGIILIEGYGQTEGTTATSANPKFGERKVGSVGIRLPYNQYRIVELDINGNYVRDCDVDEAGEVAIKGPNVFSGYKQAEHNEGLWLDDGWFITGDLGRKDNDGYLWLTGRSKDLIIRGGHNIDPQMIEEAYYKHPDVVEAVAIGKPDKVVGELPVIVVQLSPNSKITHKELLNFGKENISERAAVPKEVHVVEVMPVTAVGKIFKPTLRNELVKQQVKAELLNDLALECAVEVVSDKKFGQCVNVVVATEQHDAIKALLGDYAFKLNLIEYCSAGSVKSNGGQVLPASNTLNIKG